MAQTFHTRRYSPFTIQSWSMLFSRRRLANSCGVIIRSGSTDTMLADSLFVRLPDLKGCIIEGMQPALTLKIPPIPVEQIFAQLQEQVDKVSAFLPALDAVEGPDENCYRWIFKGLLMETRDGFANAAEAWKANDYRRLAWATRSLVELKIWTKYAIASKDNALALNREYDVDNGNMWALWKQALNTDAGQQLFSEIFPIPLSEITAKVQQRLDSVGLTGDEDYMRMGKVAKEVGLLGEYKYVNSTLSKFVHATGLSILVDPEKARMMMPMNCVGACLNVKQIFEDIQVHLPKVGLPTF